MCNIYIYIACSFTIDSGQNKYDRSTHCGRGVAEIYHIITLQLILRNTWISECTAFESCNISPGSVSPPYLFLVQRYQGLTLSRPECTLRKL